MRAEMTLATGVVPVALGITMALMSGMTRAEDKAAQTPSIAVSAQTTIPSVGHRPDAFNGEIGTMRQHEVSGKFGWGISSILTPMVGQGLILLKMGKYSPDKDNQFGASERSIEHKGPGRGIVNFACDIYRDDKLIAQKEVCTEKINGYDKDLPNNIYIFKPDDIGKTIKIIKWRYTLPESATGYIATPQKSLHSELVVGPVIPGYSSDLSELIVTAPTFVSARNSWIFYFILTARDTDGRIMTYNTSMASSKTMPALGNPVTPTHFDIMNDGSRKVMKEINPSEWPTVPTNYETTVFFEGRPVFIQKFTLNPDKTIRVGAQEKYPYCTLGSNYGEIGQACNE